MENASRYDLFRTVASIGPIIPAGFFAFGLAGKLLGNLASADERQAVLRSLPYNPTTEMDLALWDIARKLAADPDALTFMLEHSLAQLAEAYQRDAMPSGLQHNLAAFLQTYGHRGVAEIDMGVPRWSDDPTHILGYC
ncbi:hypothetical protein [Dictyobacter kobayashii]|uniref:hypothetical protein n=1 Tax=Dictyobacter kobayashii TaxID=2014872 RepID=UPI000F8195DB|nr:hypothetical protein [Dictyobacter kobayashii]